MLTVTPGDIEAALLSLIPQLATRVPDDILSGLVAARETETGARARIVLDQLVQNACVAADDCVPICEDTGTVWVCLEAGPDVLVPGNVFSRVNDAVAKSYIDARLRKSVVKMRCSTAATRKTIHRLSVRFILSMSRGFAVCM